MARPSFLSLMVLAAATVLAPADCASASDDLAASSFLKQHCFACHSGDKPKGDLRLDHLSTDLADETDRKGWLSAIARIKAGEMPPKEKPRPPRNEIQRLSD